MKTEKITTTYVELTPEEVIEAVHAYVVKNSQDSHMIPHNGNDIIGSYQLDIKVDSSGKIESAKLTITNIRHK